MIKSLIQFFVSLLIMISITNCNKTDDTDITEYSWKLKSINAEGETFRPTKRAHLFQQAYLLQFDSDTAFTFNTSVNHAMGKYIISQKGEVSIINYREISRAGAADPNEQIFNKRLAEVFNEATTYTVKGRALTFKGSKGEVIFKRN